MNTIMNITNLFDYLQNTNQENFQNLSAIYGAYTKYDSNNKPLFLAANPKIFSIIKQIEMAEKIYSSMGSSFLGSVKFMRSNEIDE